MARFLELRTFAAVVDAGSFVEASDALAMSKAAVSRYVGDLESRLGVRLLNRTTRSLSLTEEGDVFHTRCRELLGGIEEAEAEISSRSGEASGALRVTVPVSFGTPTCHTRRSLRHVCERFYRDVRRPVPAYALALPDVVQGAEGRVRLRHRSCSRADHRRRMSPLSRRQEQ